jgi:hypothetical protein
MPEWLHQAIMWLHIAGGLVAIGAGTLAVAARKGGARHTAAGNWFVAAMLTLGVSAAILEPFRMPNPGSSLVGIFVCYFVLTSWVTARNRDGATGRFELAAGLIALGFAAAILWGGVSEGATPVGRGPAFIAAGLSALAGWSDIRAYLRRKLSPAQRLSRHLWRMCFAFFIATGSFFIGQQNVLPAAVRGSPALFALGFAPLLVMIWWLGRLRFAKPLGRILGSIGQGRPIVNGG